MIIGHGIDIVDLKRFYRMNHNRLNRLALRICTEKEFSEFTQHQHRHQFIAKIWAAKEAISKAFGTGIRNNVTWKNIQIKSNEYGKPCVWFQECIAGPTCHLSISHEKDFLIASAILDIT